MATFTCVSPLSHLAKSRNMKDNSPSRAWELGFSVKKDRIASAIFCQFNEGKKWNLCDCRPMLEHAIDGGRVDPTMLTPRASELGLWAISRDERTCYALPSAKQRKHIIPA
jgi:hypothetical protein